ncbi:MAG: hypothetical protein QN178_02750 [Armatimonadota bacterium]|nr:hypothetical protein [Armatimonadota bacterium]
MVLLNHHTLSRYRRAIIRRHRVRTAAGALRFVNALGFCYAFTGGPGGLPGLFDVLDTRSIDRMWTWAWRWKDELVTTRRVHYGKVIRRKPSYVSLTLLPAFYALSGNVGEPDDHMQAFREGRLSVLARAVYEHILAHGPISTWALRRLYVPRGESGARFHRALDDLQERFLVAKVAEEEEWRNGFIWDAFHRWMPQVVHAAGSLSTPDAAAQVMARYAGAVGAISEHDVTAMFGWTLRLTHQAAERARLEPAYLEDRPVWAAPAIRRLSL